MAIRRLEISASWCIVMANVNKQQIISERAQSMLKCLIERYIDEGHPIASRTIAEMSDLGLSSASIRHVLADLEEMGLLQMPHTSAGRIPTHRGYRLFVDSLLNVQHLNESVVEKLKQALGPDKNTQDLLTSASSIMAELTDLTSIVTTPTQEHLVLRHIEFLSLSQKRILTIFVFNQQEVHNRVITTDSEYSLSDLEQAANYINDHYVGMELNQIREALIFTMHADRQRVEQLMQTVMDTMQQALQLQDASKSDLVVDGESNLLGLADSAGIERVIEIFSAFNHKREILHLLDRCIGAEGIHIFIGEESGYEMLQNCSIVGAPYQQGQEILGVLAVVGPTRMHYEMVIPMVDVTAKLLSAALSSDS